MTRAETRRLFRGVARISFLLMASACTVVSGPVERPQPRFVPGPVPERDEEPFDSVAPLDDVEPVRPFEEVRALWVVRFTMTSEEAVRRLVDDAQQAGINTLLVQVRGRADAFYRSDLEPVGQSVDTTSILDPLALVIQEAHARGIAVHAWVNTHLVWGPAALPRDSTHLVLAHPDWLAVPRQLGKELVGVDPFDPRYVQRLIRYAEENPGTVEGIYTSPSHPSVQDRVHAVWLDLATRYDLDGIHFDYIRFPSADFDYSIGALERFRLWARNATTADRFQQLDAAYVSDLFAFVEGEPRLWDEFRRQQVTRLVERIHRDVKAINPRLVISAAVIADVDLAYRDRFQDWPAWLEAGLVDVVVPMAYTPNAGRFRSLVRSATVAARQRRHVWAGIGAYMNTADGTIGMIDIARVEGAGGVVLFSYDWAVGEGRGDPANPFLRRIGRARFGR
jgi:uncharacterized lipoprotein YddW (UPF0748 family)